MKPLALERSHRGPRLLDLCQVRTPKSGVSNLSGADSLLPPVTQCFEGLFSACLASGGSQQPDSGGGSQILHSRSFDADRDRAQGEGRQDGRALRW